MLFVSNKILHVLAYLVAIIMFYQKLLAKRVFIHGLSRKFPNIQNSPPLHRPSGAQQALLSNNEFDEVCRKNRIALSCLVIVLCFFM
jgi:hypothetical protein